MSKCKRCSATALRIEKRPHLKAGRSDKGHPTWDRAEGFRERFYCRLEEGHEGRHQDFYKMVGWTDSVQK